MGFSWRDLTFVGTVGVNNLPITLHLDEASIGFANAPSGVPESLNNLGIVQGSMVPADIFATTGFGIVSGFIDFAGEVTPFSFGPTIPCVASTLRCWNDGFAQNGMEAGGSQDGILLTGDLGTHVTDAFPPLHTSSGIDFTVKVRPFLDQTLFDSGFEPVVFVPEPATSMLVGSGLLLMAFRRRNWSQ